jgi:hypothetical protein
MTRRVQLNAPPATREGGRKKARVCTSGARAGWNYQVAPAWLIGVEGDFAYANEASIFHGRNVRAEPAVWGWRGYSSAPPAWRP